MEHCQGCRTGGTFTPAWGGGRGREREESVIWHSHFKKHRQFLLRVNIPSSYDPAIPHLDIPKRNACSAHQSLAPGSSQQLCSQKPKPGDNLVLIDRLAGKQSVLQSTMEHYTATKQKHNCHTEQHRWISQILR